MINRLRARVCQVFIVIGICYGAQIQNRGIAASLLSSQRRLCRKETQEARQRASLRFLCPAAAGLRNLSYKFVSRLLVQVPLTPVAHQTQHEQKQVYEIEIEFERSQYGQFLAAFA